MRVTHKSARATIPSRESELHATLSPPHLLRCSPYVLLRYDSPGVPTTDSARSPLLSTSCVRSTTEHALGIRPRRQRASTRVREAHHRRTTHALLSEATRRRLGQRGAPKHEQKSKSRCVPRRDTPVQPSATVHVSPSHRPIKRRTRDVPASRVTCGIPHAVVSRC
ncbi:hypothetical protein OH76DRAFT_332614 [Lentinus brumalis]|uniref:Uncharacterized protein n=1 Tax=Lentinus brumalis TaxID=2498619 RepID=A0A371CJU5_9APHY|nr:hypothetical protein OH76DRAFT_332614 [Polyporus brumalis]